MSSFVSFVRIVRSYRSYRSYRLFVRSFVTEHDAGAVLREVRPKDISEAGGEEVGEPLSPGLRGVEIGVGRGGEGLGCDG